MAFMTGKIIVSKFSYFSKSILGLLVAYWYSIIVMINNDTIEWELFLDRFNYKSKKVDRGLFSRNKARKISYGIGNSCKNI